MCAHTCPHLAFLSNLDFPWTTDSVGGYATKSKAKTFVGTKRQGPFASVCKDCSHSDWLRQEICCRLTLAEENFLGEGYCYSSCIWAKCTGICPCLEPAHFLDKDQDLTSACFLILSYSSFVQKAKCEAQSISCVGCGAAKQKPSKQTILPFFPKQHQRWGRQDAGRSSMLSEMKICRTQRKPTNLFLSLLYKKENEAFN